jgi:SAM-dependent methyltransferase
MFAENTNHPYKMWVVSNSSQKETIDILKDAKLKGKIFEYLISPVNDGYVSSFLLTLNEIEKRGEKTKYTISVEDDMIPPLLCSRKDIKADWLSQLIYEFERNGDERWGCLSLRLDRTRRVDIDEEKSKIRHYKSAPSTIRIMLTEDLMHPEIYPKLRKHWSTQWFGELFRSIGKRYGCTSHIYMNHEGFAENKGYGSRNDFLTFSENHRTQEIDQPKANLDDKCFLPLSVNTSRDAEEQKLRDEYWANVGKQNKTETKKKSKQRSMAGEIAEKEANGGMILDLGCGNAKVSNSENCVGIDLFPYSNSVDIVSGIDDLYFIESSSISAVVSCHSLEHVSVDTKKVLLEWDRVLKPLGVMIIILPDGEYRNGKSCVEKSHKVCLTKGMMDWILRRMMGYKIERLENISFLRDPKKAFICVARKPVPKVVSPIPSAPKPLSPNPTATNSIPSVQCSQILSATYGTPDARIDVLPIVDEFRSKEETFTVCNKLFTDPCPKKKKELRIKYIWGEVEQDELCVREGEKIRFIS